MPKRKIAAFASRAMMTFGLTALMVCIGTDFFAQADAQELTVTADFADKPSVLPTERIELRLSRALQKTEGQLAVLVGQSDLTSLFAAVEGGLRYNAETLPLPEGETEVTVYLVSPVGVWKEIARFPLRVSKEPPAAPAETKPAEGEPEKKTEGAPTQPVEEKPAEEKSAEEKPAETAEAKPEGEAQPQDAPPQADGATEQAAKRFGFDKLDVVPTLNLNLESQGAEKVFPAENRSARPTFADLGVQASLKTEMARGTFNAQHQYDFVGTSFQEKALRFGELQDRAPLVDLSSYLMQFQAGKVKYATGHTSFGTHRHLITHSSRGMTLNIPLNPKYDLSFGALNGTTVVGFGNFFGLNKRRHQLASATLGAEFLPKRPGGLRLETSLLSGWLLPVAGFTEGLINNAERSRGVGVRLLASDPAQRFRFEGGFARSQFTSPADPTLDQGNNVVEFPNVTRNARYVEAAYDLLKDFALGKPPQQEDQNAPPQKKINLTLGFKHETVDPLYRSLGASTQADKANNEISLNGSIGEITAQFTHTRAADNLANIPSILKTFNRSNNLTVGLPLTAIVGNPATPSPLLPRVSYAFNRNHNYADALPVNGGFEVDLSGLVNQFATNHSFTANWQIKEFQFDYAFTRSFQDNRLAESEFNDVIDMNHKTGFKTTVRQNLDLGVDFNADGSRNRKDDVLERTFRLGPSLTWRMGPNSTFSATIAGTLKGDVANTRDNQDSTFDLSFVQKFALEKSRFRKVQGQFSVRYFNGYTLSRDNLFGLRTITKTQTLNIGLSFTFF